MTIFEYSHRHGPDASLRLKLYRRTERLWAWMVHKNFERYPLQYTENTFHRYGLIYTIGVCRDGYEPRDDEPCAKQERLD